LFEYFLERPEVRTVESLVVELGCALLDELVVVDVLGDIQVSDRTSISTSSGCGRSMLSISESAGGSGPSTRRAPTRHRWTSSKRSHSSITSGGAPAIRPNRPGDAVSSAIRSEGAINGGHRGLSRQVPPEPDRVVR
jgi:hypothetical protein